jgi:DNA-binding CsgD family transcriptional regulator
MLPDKLTLLEQINTAILKNSCRGEESLLDNFSTRTASDKPPAFPLESKLIAMHEKSAAEVKLEQRMQILESQNDRLLYFIHYLYKNFPELVKDILSTCQEYVKDIPPTLAAGHYPEEQPFVTPREGEVLQLLSRGLRAKEIACRLYISESTVITHKKNLKEKFKAKNTAELISKAYHLSSGVE